MRAITRYSSNRVALRERFGAALLWLLAASVLTTGPRPVSGAGLSDTIRAETELLRASGRIGIDGIDILEPEAVAEVYERHRFSPFWSDAARIDALLDGIRASIDEGLNPGGYHLQRIERLRESQARSPAPTRRTLAAFDILLTDSLARLALDLRFGRVDRHQRTDALQRALEVEQLLAAASLASALAAVTPDNAQYLGLRDALRDYRRLQQIGGWPAVAEGPTIRPGAADPRLAQLARRLAGSGDLSPDPDDTTSYDDAMQRAVRRFQARHTLEPDAVVGPATRRALNVPVAARIDQIRLNLERARWIGDTPDHDFISVNLPMFEAYLVRNGAVQWTTRVIVGQAKAETPLFESRLKYVVLNPTWTVPYGIASNELLPDIKADPSYLDRNGYQVFDATGIQVDPAQVEWSALHANNFGYTLVQQAGPANQLGRIKFVFPNAHAVFMHDTPNRNLFARASRAFSHGCVRIERPTELATLLLERQGWSRERLESHIATGDTETIFLTEPLALRLVYWTATVDDSGAVHFANDIYGRDAALLTALDAVP